MNEETNINTIKSTLAIANPDHKGFLDIKIDPLAFPFFSYIAIKTCILTSFPVRSTIEDKAKRLTKMKAPLHHHNNKGRGKGLQQEQQCLNIGRILGNNVREIEKLKPGHHKISVKEILTKFHKIFFWPNNSKQYYK